LRHPLDAAAMKEVVRPPVAKAANHGAIITGCVISANCALQGSGQAPFSARRGPKSRRRIVRKRVPDPLVHPSAPRGVAAKRSVTQRLHIAVRLVSGATDWGSHEATPSADAGGLAQPPGTLVSPRLRPEPNHARSDRLYEPALAKTGASGARLTRAPCCLPRARGILRLPFVCRPPHQERSTSPSRKPRSSTRATCSPAGCLDANDCAAQGSVGNDQRAARRSKRPLASRRTCGDSVTVWG
jgi:hypothetical protein